MKKFTQAGKKALSVFLAALMVMTAWVFVAPEAKAQNAGSYYVKIYYEVTNKLDNFMFTGTDYDKPYKGKSSVNESSNDNNCTGMSLFYKTNNGTGTSGEVYWNIGKQKGTTGLDIYGGSDGTSVSPATQNTQSEKTGYATATIPGFPTGIYMFNNNNHTRDACHWKITKLEIASSSDKTLQTIWSGEIFTASQEYRYFAEISATANSEHTKPATLTPRHGGNNDDKDNSHATTDTNGNKWVFPYAKTITWNPTTLSAMTCPKTGTATQTVKVTAKDQYGVNMYDPTWSVKGSSCGTTGISMSTGSSRAESSTIKLTNAANIAKTTDTQTGTVTATWGSGQTKSKTFTINDTTYTATFTGLKNNDGTDKANVMANYKHGHVPTAAATASEYDVGDYHRTFSHWSPSIGAITSDTTYNARYSESFVGANLTELNNQISRANDVKDTDLWKTSSYTQETMSALESALEAAIAKRDSNPGRTQQDAVDAVAKNLKDAIDALALKTYTVKFYNAEGLIIKTQEVVAGQAATAPASPAKDDDETYHYSFKAWDTAFNNVTSNLDVRPTYTPEAHVWQTSTTVPANCQHGAGIKKTCSVCSRVSESYDDTLGAHTKSTHYAVSREATCTADGTGYYYCTVCGTNMGNVTIKAKGHTYDKGEVTKAATCTATGTRVHKCNSCGDTYTEILEKIPHTYAKTSTVAATCKHSAYDVMKCSCGDTYNKYVGGIAEHELVWTVKNATSASSGSVTGKCKNCDYTFTKEVPFDGHNYDFDNPTIKAATCNADGSVVIGCKDAGCTEKITIKLNKTEVHNYTTKYNAPSCAKAGSIVNTCSVCNTSTTVETIAALGHNYGEAVITPATCTTDGKMVYTCARCNDVKTVPILATGHKEYVIDAIEATCNTKGRTEGKKCDVCGEVILASTEIAKKAHSFTGEVKTIAATCDADGATLTKCANCDAWKIDNIPAIGHNYKAEVVASTCTSKGYTKHTCQNCGKVYTDNETAMIAHNYVLNADLSLAPSCEGEGVNIYVCSVCHSGKSEKVDAKGHSFGEWSEYIPATCTSNGVETRTCTVSGCGATETRKTNALGHAYATDFTTDIPATCKSAGVKSKHCSRCDAREDVTVIPALPHNWNAGVETTAATCTTDGVKTFTCASCNTTKTEVIPKLGHNFVAGEPVAATCRSSGYIPYTCTNGCSKSYKVINGEADNTAHNWNFTTSKNGTKLTVTWTCETCGATGTQTVDVAEGHNYVNATVTKQPTCKETGTVTIACDKAHDASCSSVVTATLPVNPDAHSAIKTTVTNPTCTENGKVTTVCEACNATVYAEQTIPAKGHSFSGAPTNYVAPTCKTEGSVTYTCTVSGCGAIKTDTIPVNPNAHKFIQKANGHHDATCTTPAYDEYVCEYGCGETYNKYDGGEVNAHEWKTEITQNGTELTITCTCKTCGASHTETKTVFAGHKYTKVEEVKAATCTAPGELKISCSDEGCNASITAEVPKNENAHSELKTTVIPAKCETNGTATTVCESCGKTIGESATIAALGHNYVDGEETVITAATCENDGKKTVKCTRCTNTMETVIPKTGHSWELKEIVAATCKAAGYKVYVCKHDDTHTYKEFLSDPVKHTEGEWVTKRAATCCSNGYEVLECKDCGAIMNTKDIPATNEHNFVEVKSDNAEPTCTEGSYSYKKCSACGKLDNESFAVKNALGHDFSVFVEKQDATATENGYVIYRCSRCDATLKSFIPASGHNYTSEVTKEPTCTETGVRTYTCTAEGHDDSYTEEIPALGHKAGKAAVTEATCLAQGSVVVKCTRCGDTLQTEPLPTLAHTFNEAHKTVIPATCQTNGSITYTCATDGCTETLVTVIDKLPHDYEFKRSVAPTCLDSGYDIYECVNFGECKASYNVVTKPANGHSFFEDTARTVQPTCSTVGHKYFKCSVCGTEGYDYEVPATGRHNYTETAAVPATCESAGYTYKKCTCGAVEESSIKALDALGHDYSVDEGNGVFKCARCDSKITVEKTITEEDGTVHALKGTVTKQSTCKEQGTIEYVCQIHENCSKNHTEALPLAAHSANADSIVKTEPHCNADGSLTDGSVLVKCSVCGEQIGDTVVLPAAHKYTVVKVERANCASKGKVTERCSVCGHEKVTELEMDASAHEFNSLPSIKVAPTCTTDGYEVYDCKHCDAQKFVKTGVMLDHGKTKTQTKNPTCTAEGYVRTTCEYCGTVIDETVLQKLPHTEKTVTIPATCTEKGSKTVVCSVCHTILKETEYIPALGHDWGEWKVTVPGTCTVEGKKTRECSRCHETETISTGTGEHVYPEKGVVTPATCTADGYTTYTCTVCNKYSVIRDYTPKLGHKYSADYKIIVEPTCHSTGTKAHYCVRCGAFEPDYLHNYVELPKLAHTYGEWVVTTEPTCDKNGVKTRTCTGCTDKDEGHTQTELIGKKGHNYGEWEITKKSTCVEEGSQRRYCDRCKTWEVQATPKGGHNRVADYAVEATCTAPGKTVGSHCSICGYVFVAQQEVPMKEHMDLNGDGRCEGCGKTMYSPNGETDSCLCHGTGFRAFIYKIVLIIWKIFKINKNCVCGAKHY